MRHQRPAALRRRFLPTLEELEPRYVFNTAVITAVTPDVGPISGGAAVTLTGSGFTGSTAVSFGNGHPAGFVVLSDSTLQVTSPAESAGVVDILVTNASGQSAPATADQYTYTNQPSLTAISPNLGSTAGGNMVTITGMNLGNATTVMFGDVPATSFTDSKNQITATAPAHAAGLVDVQVVTANGTTPITAADQYTYVVPAPVITGVSPDSGSSHGGQQITISGTDLTNASQVSFGGTPAVSFNVVSASQILATAPPDAAGTVDVTVTTPGGTSALSTADDFTYIVPAPVITGINVGSGSTAGGTPVILTGTDLSGAKQVLFGMTPSKAFTVVSDDEIMATAPAGLAGTVDVTVTTAGGTSATSAADQFTYVVPAPVISGLTPATGSTAGGTQVLITGTNLGGVTAVSFGVVPATSFASISATQIEAVAPAGLAGNADVRVTTAGGQSALASADQFQYVAPPPPAPSRPTVTGITISGATSGGGMTLGTGGGGMTLGTGGGSTTITITGTSLSGATQVLFGQTPATSFTVDSDTQITAVAPTEAAGTHVSVTVQTAAGKSAPSPSAGYTTSANGSMAPLPAAPPFSAPP